MTACNESMIVVENPLSITQIESVLRMVRGLCKDSFKENTDLNGRLCLLVPKEQLEVVLATLIGCGLNPRTRNNHH